MTINLNWPILPLDLWRQVISYNPWHFWGLADATVVPVNSKCNTVVREYSWQEADQSGREDIRQAIITAERLLFDNMEFWPAPVYSSEILPWPRYHNLRLERINRRDAQGRWIPIVLNEGYIRDIGIEKLDLIAEGAAITYTDHDGDGLKEDWSVTVATSVDVSEIAVYFSDGDMLPGDDVLSDRWRIEPVRVMRSGGNVTIYGKRWLMVKPLLYEDKDNYPLDPTVDANFISLLDVYRRYTYTEGVDSNVDSQSALIWESRPCLWGCDSTNSSTDPYSEGWVAGRSGIRDSVKGIVIPAEAVYNATSGTWNHPYECFSSCGGEPDKVLIRYLAGIELDTNGWMSGPMRTLVARLAAAEMTRRICACDAANREWSNWQFDVSRLNSPETYQINLDTLSNPLGTRRGHIYAWQQIRSLARMTGTLA